ncbi:MAG: TonB-dependent receptor family protein [Candidatus Halalkalibacterium sp. M3_1C_030]|jgi:Fe(3+) dicitrate transport protein
MHSIKITKYAVLLFLLVIGFSFQAAGQEKKKEETAKDSLEIYDEIILDRIMVIGKPDWMDKIPGSASYISSKQLQQQNYSDINRVLRTVPGINIQEEDGFGLRPNIGLRGTGVERSSKITLMEDGVLIAPAPYSAPAAYYFPTIGRMSSVEVRKGSSQIKYGPNTTGGAINLISTPIPYELSGQAEVSFGDYSTRKLNASVGNTYKNFGFLLETYQMENDGFKNLASGGDNTGFDTKDFLGKLMFRTNPDAPVFQKVELKAGYYDELSNETYLGLTQSDFETNPYRRYAASQRDEMDADQTQLQLRYFVLFSENLDVTTTLYRNDFNRNWYKLDKVNGTGIADLLENPRDNQEAYNIARGSDSQDDALALKANNRAYFSQGIQSVVGYQFGLGKAESELEVGLRYHQDEMDRFQWVDGYRMEDGIMIQSSAGQPGTESNRIESARAASVYLQDRISYGDWVFTPGVRYENINLKREDFGKNDPERTGANLNVTDKTLDVLVPGIGINYQAAEQINVFGGVHKGFAPPSPGASVGTKSEVSVNYELGFRYQRNNLRIETTGFFNDYSNLLGTDLAAGGGGGTTQQFNAGEVNVTGVEFLLQYDLAGTDRVYSLPVNVTYTFTRARFQNGFNSDYDPWGEVQKGDEMPYLPKHQAQASAGIQKGKFGLFMDAYTTSRMRTVAGSGEIDKARSTDAYLLFDVSGSYRLIRYAEIFLNARNLTDQTYIVSRRPAGLRPGLPRTLLLGLKLEI